MICKECGHLLNEGDRFCPNCGAKVVAQGPASNMGTSKSKLDALMSNLNYTTDQQKASDNWSTEAPKHKREFQFEKINWNLDGYPSEGKKETEDIDFNWEAVVEPNQPETEEVVSKEAPAVEENSYLGKVDEEFKDTAKDDRETFRAMEADAPGFEECVADKLKTPEEKPTVPEFMEGQNYDVVGVTSDVTPVTMEENADPEKDVEEYIENLNTGEVSLVELLKAAAKKEDTPSVVEPAGSYLGEVNEEFKDPAKDDRETFRAMEADAPGFEECVADKLDTPEEKPVVPEFMEGQNYDVVGEASEQIDEGRNTVEPVEFVDIAQPQEQAPIFATVPEEVPAFTKVISEKVDLTSDDLLFADNLSAQNKENDFDYAQAVSGIVAEKEEPKSENSQIIEEMIKEDIGEETAHPDERITFQDVFKEEIMAEKETPKETKPKKHTLLKVLFIILMVLILLEVVVIGIKYLAPNSGAAVAIQDIFNTIFGKLVG